MKLINIIEILFFCLLLFRCKEVDLNPDPNRIPNNTIVDGVVLDSANNSPIPSVTIIFLKEPMFSLSFPFDTLYSDSLGKFYKEIHHKRTDTIAYIYNIKVEKKGYSFVANNFNEVMEGVAIEKHASQKLVIKMKKN